MKTWIAIGLILISMSAVYGAPRNPNPNTPDQTWQNDKDLNDAIAFNLGYIPSKTLAVLKTTTPKRKGLVYFCTDCVNAFVCVSTGTVLYGFASMQATNRTTACN